jgi:hypothetical protein
MPRRKIISILVLFFIMLGIMQPQPIFAGTISGGISLSCAGINGSGASVTFNRNNTGQNTELYRVAATDGNGRSIFFVTGAFSVGTTTPVGSSGWTSAPTANPLTLSIVSLGGNGLGEETIYSVTGSCAGLPTGTGGTGGTSGGGGASGTSTSFDVGKFTLHTITCNTAVFDEPGGNAIADTRIIAGQTWFVGTAVKSKSGQSWTPINVSGPKVGFIPTICVA